MATITEDYVSFETAKLLKEKGFDWECISYYVDDEPDDVKYSFLGETNSTWKSRCCSAPTFQMAMKWLREVHGLYIEVLLSCDRKDKNAKIFDASIFNIQNQRYKKLSSIQGYEGAVEAAIKYCLENLI